MNFAQNQLRNEIYIPGTWSQAGSSVYYSQGNVGIGTVSPNATLDVRGTSNILSPTNSGAALYVNGNPNQFGLDSLIKITTTGGNQNGTSPYLNRAFLELQSNTTQGNYGYNMVSVTRDVGTVGEKMYSYINGSGSAYFAGSVGIVIASPLAPFHVFSNVGASFSNTTSVNYQQTSVIGFNYGGGVGAGTRDSFRIISSVVNRDNGVGPYYDYGAQADLVFQRKTNNLYSGGATDQTYTEVMRLGGATGYVGIGTTSPTTALQVNGGQISVPSYISSVGSPYTTSQQFYFAFNGNLTDSQSGATTTPTGNAGGFVDNAAIRFNGNYYFTFPNSTVTSTVSITVAFWFCPLSSSGSQTILGFGNGSTVNLNIDANGSGGLQAYIATPNQWTVATLSTGALNLGTWYHIAYTCSTTAATCYVNGVQVNQQTGTYTNGSFGMGTVYVGTNADGQSRRANCLLDELRIYNTALTGAQVATLYSSVTFTPNGMSGGSVLTNCVGVGVTTPVNSIDTSGAVAIGSYAGANQAPAGGLICPGNVGIGTTNPVYAFQVDVGSASSTGQVVIENPSNTNNGYGSQLVFGIYNPNTSQRFQQGAIGSVRENNAANYTSSLALYSFNNSSLVECMRMNSSGNVGIGMVSPQQALDVAGNIRMNTYMLPYIQYGTSTGNYYFVIDFGATGYHTYVITLRFNQTAGGGGGIYFYARDTALTQMTTTEYSETYFRAGQYATGNQAYIATNNEQGTDATSRLQIEQSIGTGNRCNYMFETVFCWQNVGQTRCISQGWFTGGNNQVRTITIYNTNGSATTYLQTAYWTVQRFYTS